jgi:hypothetical protein
MATAKDPDPPLCQVARCAEYKFGFKKKKKTRTQTRLIRPRRLHGHVRLNALIFFFFLSRLVIIYLIGPPRLTRLDMNLHYLNF